MDVKLFSTASLGISYEQHYTTIKYNEQPLLHCNYPFKFQNKKNEQFASLLNQNKQSYGSRSYWSLHEQ